MVLPLLFSGVHSPTVWRPPCVWHEIKAHEYHNNQSLGVLLRPRSFVGLLHLRPTGQRPPSHLHIFGRRPPSHLHIFGSRQACLYCLRHDPRRATSSSTGTTRRQRRPLQHSAKTGATALARPPRASIHLQLTVHVSYLASAHKVALMVFVYSTG